MSNTPQISVICPVYQAENYIRRCIDSVLNQHHTDFELILVDDGSTDQSGAICDEYAEKDSRVRVIHQPNGGVCSARNRGVDEAKGEYSIHVDPDDWVEPDFLSALYEKAVSEGADVVFSDYYLQYHDRQFLQKQQPTALSHEVVVDDLLHRLHGSCWNKLLRRSIYTEHNIRFPEGLTIWEDLYFNVLVCSHEVKVAYVDRALYHYDFSSNTNSLVRRGNRKTLESQCWVVAHLADVVKDPSQLDELKIMTKERAFFTEGTTANEVVELYREVNPLYLSRRDFKRMQWVSLALTLRVPKLFPLAKFLMLCDRCKMAILHRLAEMLGRA